MSYSLWHTKKNSSNNSAVVFSSLLQISNIVKGAVFLELFLQKGFGGFVLLPVCGKGFLCPSVHPSLTPCLGVFSHMQLPHSVRVVFLRIFLPTNCKIGTGKQKICTVTGKKSALKK
jgi:hypothetical protein